MKKINIIDKVFYIGVNDRKKHLFENNWPLPNGVAYNSYVIADEKTAVIDTLEYGSKQNYLETIADHIDGRDLDYLIVNHMEPDHAGMIGDLLRRYPNLKVVANKITFRMLHNFYNLSESNFMEVKEGDVLDLGHHKLTFVLTPWVHWPETMMTYDTTDKILFSCDAFGSYGSLDGGIYDDQVDFDRYYLDEMRRYYSNIVAKWSPFVQKAFQKLAGVEVAYICPSHGVIWRKDINKVLGLYDKWSKYESEEGVVIAYASMYGNTEEMADQLGRVLAEKGVKNIRIFDTSKTDISFIISEIWRYKGLILGTCAYNATMHPKMAALCHELEIASPKNKVFGLFGSSSWNGAGVKCMKKFAETNNLEITGEIVEVSGAPFEEKIAGFNNFAETFVEALK